MPQDPPRNDVDPDDLLLDFDSEVSHSAVDKKESDLNDQELFFNTQERDTTSGKRDVQPDGHGLPLNAPSAHPFVWYTPDPVVHSSARRNIGIALLILVSIGALAWSGRLWMGMQRDAGTPGAQIHNASQPTPTVPPEAPTKVLPPAPDPQLTATDVPQETATPPKPAPVIATPSEARAAKAADAPRAERPARQAERLPIKTEPNPAGGLFAITRPVGAQVFVDNKLIGTTPLFMSQLSSGSHQVRLELPGFSTYSSSIQVEPNTRFRLAVQLDETR